MSFEIEGKLHKKFETERKTDSFQVRAFVLQTESGSYQQYIKFQLTQDRCGLLDDIEEGTSIKVHFDIRGNEWNGRYITNLNAWRIEKPSAAEASPAAPAAPATTDDGFPSEADAPAERFDDDLPF